MSLNVVVNHVAEHAITADQHAADRLRNRLAAANSRWDAVCKSAARIQGKLQTALMQVMKTKFCYHGFIGLKIESRQFS